MMRLRRMWYRWQLKQNQWARNELNALIAHEFDVLARSDQELFNKLEALEKEYARGVIRSRLTLN